MHEPVLLKEVLDIFDPRPGEHYIDATINGGGHAFAILEKIGSMGKMLGIDWDCNLIEELKVSVKGGSASGGKNLELVCDNYADIRSIVREHHLDKIGGILFDLGFSSYHLEESQKGFSFLKDEPLDMRYSREEKRETAADIINRSSKKAIEDIIREFGEERFAKNIAERIAESRRRHPIRRTTELADIIQKSVPQWYCRQKIHCATRTFQALRIAVNAELKNIEEGVRDAIDILSPGGKLIVLSFHSLEDRIIKRIFQEAKKGGRIRILTKKVIRPLPQEARENPRARSAKLRALEKIV